MADANADRGVAPGIAIGQSGRNRTLLPHRSKFKVKGQRARYRLRRKRCESKVRYGLKINGGAGALSGQEKHFYNNEINQ
jgi:hypothetical protein